MNAFGNRDDAAAEPVVGFLHGAKEFFDLEGSLRNVDQVRAIAGELPAERRSGGEESSMAAHYHADVHTRQGGVVEIGARECLGDEAGRGGEARRVVVADEVVVDGFRNVDGAQRIIGLLRLLADDAHGIGGIVAADIEKGADFVRAQHFKNLLAILGIRLVAGRAECRRRRARNHFKIVARLLRQVDQVFVDDAAHAVLGAVNASDVGKPAGFKHNANKRLIDDSGWAATLGDQNFCCHEIHLAPILSQFNCKFLL